MARGSGASVASQSTTEVRLSTGSEGWDRLVTSAGSSPLRDPALVATLNKCYSTNYSDTLVSRFWNPPPLSTLNIAAFIFMDLNLNLAYFWFVSGMGGNGKRKKQELRPMIPTRSLSHPFRNILPAAECRGDRVRPGGTYQKVWPTSIKLGEDLGISPREEDQLPPLLHRMRSISPPQTSEVHS